MACSRPNVSDKGHAFLDRALYFPKSWTDTSERLASAHVPDDIRFATKPSLATTMIEQALAAEVPFSWVAGDSVYGVGDLEISLRRAGKEFVLGVNANHCFHSWRPDVTWVGEAREIIKMLPDEAWIRCSAGHGTRGDRWYDWLYCPMADLQASEIF
ncbi:Mobile element protein [Asaia bogorensis]|uniref:Mobile element protein n=1 Tax=Asaia bogorensis TaxID=91915 RepID=A0A060QGC9_9PROT|nr:Mobile element protein [Asaia bogorensis]